MIDELSMQTMLTPSQRKLLVKRLAKLGVKVESTDMEDLAIGVAAVLKIKKPTGISDSNTMVVSYYRREEQSNYVLHLMPFKPLKNYEKKMRDFAESCERIR